MDTKIPGYGADILAAVRKITDLPVTTIINTHTHWDQAGANPEFSETVNIVTHENTAAPTATATYSSSSKEARAILVGDMMARKLLPHIDVDYAGFYNDLLMQTHEGRAAGRSAAEIVRSYALPERYSDFAAPNYRLEHLVPLMLEGR